MPTIAELYPISKPKTSKKETAMPKNNAKTAKKSSKSTAKKETAMPKNTAAKTADQPKLTGQALVMHHIDQQKAATQALIDAYAKAHKGKAPRGLLKSFVNPVTGKEFRDDNIVILAWNNYAKGYKGNRYATKRQIEVNHGTIAEDAEPVTMFCPFGKSTKMMYWEVYSLDAVTWEGGTEPTEWVKPSKSKTSKAKAAKTSKAKAAKAADNTVTMTPDQLQAIIAQAVAAAMSSVA
jgi:hypothetical protein